MITKHLLISLLLATVTGCSVFKKPEPVVVIKKEIVHISIPEALLVKCKATKPIPVEEFLSLDPIERETYLSNYATRLLGVIKDCDNRFTAIGELQPKK